MRRNLRENCLKMIFKNYNFCRVLTENCKSLHNEINAKNKRPFLRKNEYYWSCVCVWRRVCECVCGIHDHRACTACSCVVSRCVFYSEKRCCLSRRRERLGRAPEPRPGDLGIHPMTHVNGEWKSAALRRAYIASNCRAVLRRATRAMYTSVHARLRHMSTVRAQRVRAYALSVVSQSAGNKKLLR